MANRYVEDRHEAKLAKRVVDVRPAPTRYAEWLSEKFNLLIVVVPILLFASFIPSISILLYLIIAGHLIAHKVTKPVLPFRYPAGNKEKDHNGKKGNGILLLGYIDSDSEYEKFKEIWQSDDDLRKHMLIIGSTGSGKSETLKGIFFNSLCWSSGFFVADGKADNKLPTDTFTMVRSFGRDDDLLFLNFLLGGKTPEQVRMSRRRRTNKINPVSSADADTIIQMGANMLPKVEGEGKNWQEKALNLWRAVIQALCYMRDTDIEGIERADLSISTIIDYLALPKVEELFVLGYKEAERNKVNGIPEWSHGFNGVKAYLESGCPAYKCEKLLAKNGLGDQPAPPTAGRASPNSGKQFEQDSMAYEQHAYRTSQLMPVLNLLDKTYGFIFRDKYAEIDMIDATLNNRILVMLIPSLEKSAQEAENLGKLAIACLRVMMGKNLGSEIEGTRNELLNSKATAAPYPYMIALDELAYYFADGIAVMFAQARSLGFCMIAAAQDLEKLTEGARQAEAGAMLANQVSKFFMRIDDANKTYEFIGKILGKISVAVRHTFEQDDTGYKRSKEVDIQEVERVSIEEMQKKGPGEAIYNSAGKTVRAKSVYIGDDLTDHENSDFFVLRFLQVAPPSVKEIEDKSSPIEKINDKVIMGARLIEILKGNILRSKDNPPYDHIISRVAEVASKISPHTPASVRAIVLYQTAKEALLELENGSLPTTGESKQTNSHKINNDSDNDDIDDYDDYVAPIGGISSNMDDDDGIDPLEFLSFKNKPATELVEQLNSKPLNNVDVTNKDSKENDSTNDPILKLLSTGKDLNLQKDPIESEFNETEATAMRVFSGIPESESSDANWVGNAVGAAARILMEKSAKGQYVVGFTEETSDNIESVESLLGNPVPKLATSRLESVVATKITPDIHSEITDFSEDDINGFFENISK